MLKFKSGCYRPYPLKEISSRDLAGLAARRARAADAKLGRAGGRAGAAGLRRGRERGEWARGELVGPGERREKGSGPRVRLG